MPYLEAICSSLKIQFVPLPLGIFCWLREMLDTPTTMCLGRSWHIIGTWKIFIRYLVNKYDSTLFSSLFFTCLAHPHTLSPGKQRLCLVHSSEVWFMTLFKGLLNERMRLGNWWWKQLRDEVSAYTEVKSWKVLNVIWRSLDLCGHGEALQVSEGETDQPRAVFYEENSCQQSEW